MEQTTTAPMSDAEILHAYLGQRIANGDRELPVDKLLEEYRDYRQRLEEMRHKILESQDSDNEKPLDPDRFLRKLDAELIRRGFKE